MGAGAAHYEDGGGWEGGRGMLVDVTGIEVVCSIRTSVCDLAGVATGASVAVLGEGGADFVEGFKSGAVARTLVFG